MIRFLNFVCFSGFFFGTYSNYCTSISSTIRSVPTETQLKPGSMKPGVALPGNLSFWERNASNMKLQSHTQKNIKKAKTVETSNVIYQCSDL